MVVQPFEHLLEVLRVARPVCFWLVFIAMPSHAGIKSIDVAKSTGIC